MPLSEITDADDRQLQDIADALAASHKILLVTGAGISTSVGIPDFRSKDGLYNLIPEQAYLPTPPSSNPSTPSKKRKAYTTDDEELPSSQTSVSSSSSRRSSTATNAKLRGQDLFDSRVFQSAESTTIFYQFIASLRQKIHDEVKESSATHKFIRTLRDGGRLMRCYTQNIDGLEAREGLCTDLKRGKGNKRRFMKKHYEVPRPQHTQNTDFDGGCEVVQLHGDLEKLRCNVCAAQFLWRDDETEIFLEGAAPKCEKCSAKSDQRQATGKRGLSVGSLRPNIVLYGEEHPSNTLLAPFVPFDTGSEPEVLIIMGTSLKVFGLQKIVREFAKAVHAKKKGKGRVIFVNRTRPAESVWDGIIDDFISMDCENWIEDLKRRRSDLWLRQGEIDLKPSKQSMVKRKRKTEACDENTEDQATKKPRITVEIPKVRRKPGPKPKNSSSESMVSTPKHNRATPWSHAHPENPIVGNLLSPLARARRPIPSPLSKSFKPLVAAEAGGVVVPGSPKTPMFSPITPRIRTSSSLMNEMQNTNETEDICKEKDNDSENTPSQPSRFHLFSLDGTCEASDTPSRQHHFSNPRPKALSEIQNASKSITQFEKPSSMWGMKSRGLVGKLLGVELLGMGLT